MQDGWDQAMVYYPSCTTRPGQGSGLNLVLDTESGTGLRSHGMASSTGPVGPLDLVIRHPRIWNSELLALNLESIRVAI